MLQDFKVCLMILGRYDMLRYDTLRDISLVGVYLHVEDWTKLNKQKQPFTGIL